MIRINFCKKPQDRPPFPWAGFIPFVVFLPFLFVFVFQEYEHSKFPEREPSQDGRKPETTREEPPRPDTGQKETAIAKKEFPPLKMVRLPSGLWFGAFEITQIQYESIMDRKPVKASLPGYGETYPVTHISWMQAAEFCNRLSDREGLKKVYSLQNPSEVEMDLDAGGYRMPWTEEFFYALRAGSESISPDSDGWIVSNSGNAPHEIGKKRPNAWGLYDLVGNVAEWSSSYQTNSDPRTGTWRYFCGGSFADPFPKENTGAGSPFFSSPNIGFRVCRNSSNQPLERSLGKISLSPNFGGIVLRVNDSFDLGNISVTAWYSDQSMNVVTSSATWQIISGKGRVEKTRYFAPPEAEWDILTCSYGENGVIRTQNLSFQNVP